MGAPCPKNMARHSDTQSRQEGLLWYLHAAHLFHATFAFFLLFEKLALAGYVATVAFGRYVLAVGADGFAGDNALAHGGLYGDFELLAGDELLEFLDQGA